MRKRIAGEAKTKGRKQDNEAKTRKAAKGGFTTEIMRGVPCIRKNEGWRTEE